MLSPTTAAIFSTTRACARRAVTSVSATAPASAARDVMRVELRFTAWSWPPPCGVDGRHAAIGGTGARARRRIAPGIDMPGGIAPGCIAPGGMPPGCIAPGIPASPPSVRPRLSPPPFMPVSISTLLSLSS